MRLAAPSSWGFRALLLVVNVAGIWWIHHDLAGATLPGLRVLAALPSREVDETDRFTLVFDRPLTLPGRPGDERLAASPFVVTPQVAGQWVWAAPEKLEYRLDKQLPPGRRFTLAAGPALEQMLGHKLLGTSQFHFQTRALRLASCIVTSADRENANIELEFNQPVDPADLMRHMKASDAEGSVHLQFEVLTKKPEATQVIRATRPKSDKLALRIDAALAGAGADLPLGEDANQTLDVKTAFAVVDTNVEPVSFERDCCVRIRFSKELHADAAKNSGQVVRLTPKVADVRVHVDGECLVVHGAFQCGQTYTAELSADLEAAGGEKLGSEETVSFEIPDRQPGIHFETGGGILSQHGNMLVEMKHVNVPVVHLQAGRVHANNLIPHLRGEGKQATSREFPEKTIQLDAVRNEPASVAVDLRKLLDKPVGTWWLQARGSDGTWTSDSTVVAVTDLAIVAKQERSGLCVWVTSLSTARPVADAEVAAMSYNNQLLARATTDESGIARLATPADLPDGPAWAITARLGDDISYIELQKRPWVLDEVEQAGRHSPATYDVMLYTERGVYRPGDVIHLTGIIRDAAGNVPSPFPLAATVCRPDGKEIANLPVSPATNAQGVFQLEYTCPDVGQTGPYRFHVGLPGSKETLGTVETLVEEYAPQRLELKANARSRFGPNEPVQVEAAARYLFDQPAAGLPVRVNGAYRREAFSSKRFAGFGFSPPDPKVEERVTEQEVNLDESGHARLTVPSPSLGSPGLWRAELNVTVSEQGGRSVSRGVETHVDSAGRYVGLRLPGGRLVPASVPTPVEWVQLTADDGLTDRGPATYTLTHVNQDTTLQQIDGRYVWKTVERTSQVEHMELAAPTTEIGKFEVVCPDPGLYRLAVTDCASGTTAQIEFRATASENEALASAVDRPDRVALTLDRDSYSPGSTARLAVAAPFAGTMLLTVETDRVVSARVVELAGPSAELDLPIDSGIRGGAFITATVVRRIKADEQTWQPHRAIGMARLRTDHASHKLELAVDAPSRAKPGQVVPIRVQTAVPADPAKPTIVHLWAVDEGILLATDYPTPDPAGHFFAPRQAEIISADVFGDLMPDYQRPAGMTRIGGDGGGEDAYRKRLSPVATPRQAPAIIWRTAVAADADGRVAAELPMPELAGRLRVMAVAVDQDRYGSTSGALVLTTPLLVEVSCPRFVAPDDAIDIPVKIFNNTDAELTANLDLSVDGPLRLDPLTERSIRVLPAKPVVVWARAVATGLGSVSLVARAESKSPTGEVLTGKQTAAFAVRPAGPLHSESQVVAIQAGQPHQFAPLGKWLAGTAKTLVCVGPRPTVHLQAAMDELIDYPYGCVEQTTSKLYTLLCVPELLKLDGNGKKRIDVVDGMIEAGLARLWSMQTRSGGLSYWPGESQACPWGSAYAAEFVAMAERQGHIANPAFTSELVQYLEALLDGRGEEQADANLKAQLCYVLARMKRPKTNWVSRLSETVDKLDVAGRAYLAGAWFEMGRKDRAASILSDDVLSLTVDASNGTRPTSQVHEDSVLFNVLMDLDPKHPWIPALVERLEKSRTDGHWGNTMENAGALAALARYQLAGTEPASFEGVVRQGDVAHPFNHSAAQTFTLRTDQPIEITSSGEGQIYLAATTEGLLKDATQPDYDRNLVVSRRWLDRSGKPIDASRVSVGDLVLVEVKLAAPNLEEGETVDNIAVVDALPGGMEVENPRLASSEDSPGDEAGTPDRVEFRDDRVVVFSKAGRDERVFRYALRAITAGSFVVPPVQASSMYDSSMASMHGAGRVSIAR
jgi:uncharacterized protein YfaS (alpha-2-macroglobulin family)